ncbi:heavy-metal-associated domain-containing protein [Actinoplanes sp. NPDC049599]|jgi:copper chaperone CopZ|uniref:heavy-metal-associated domain-containing protein n=1 Tax=Actinoplanes sp. NPDC049599 TaxID=3363903 RepID=UPI0037B399B4
MSNNSTHTFTVTGMRSASCARRIDRALEDLPGVHRAQTSVTAGRTVVDTDPSGADLDVLVAVLASLGFTAKVQAS